MGTLTMGTPQGQPTNNMKRKDRFFKIKPIDTTGKKWVKDESYPVNTWVLRKVKH